MRHGNMTLWLPQDCCLVQDNNQRAATLHTQNSHFIVFCETRHILSSSAHI